MKVFISWSGETSHRIAVALRDWLPKVVQSLEPYVSSEDIDKGARWSTEIAGELSSSSYGILCLTESNLDAPWLNFEAGALSKSIDSSRVSPILFNLKRSEVRGPIQQFQSTIFEKEDVRKLVIGLNRADSDSRLDESRLFEIFDVFWPKLYEALESVNADRGAEIDAAKGQKRAYVDEMNSVLEEILELSRRQSREAVNQERMLSEALALLTGDSDSMLALELKTDQATVLKLSMAVREMEEILSYSNLPDFDKMRLLHAFARIESLTESLIAGSRRGESAARYHNALRVHPPRLG